MKVLIDEYEVHGEIFAVYIGNNGLLEALGTESPTISIFLKDLIEAYKDGAGLDMGDVIRLWLADSL